MNDCRVTVLSERWHIQSQDTWEAKGVGWVCKDVGGLCRDVISAVGSVRGLGGSLSPFPICALCMWGASVTLQGSHRGCFVTQVTQTGVRVWW
jgi:hypothetical protein